MGILAMWVPVFWSGVGAGDIVLVGAMGMAAAGAMAGVITALAGEVDGMVVVSWVGMGALGSPAAGIINGRPSMGKAGFAQRRAARAVRRPPNASGLA